MPILKKEPDIYPADLLDNQELLADEDRQWWCLYTMARREKDLMRKLHSREIPFYAPVIAKRYRSTGGRIRTSYIPLFANYVFMLGNETDRIEALKTNCISKHSIIHQREDLVEDLTKVFEIIQEEVTLTPESQLESGDMCRIRTGPFQDYEGIVVRRGGKTSFLVSVRFLDQSFAMDIDEGLLEPI